VLFGVGYSVTAFIVPAMMSARFRGPDFGSIFGLTQVASALGSALGAWLAGRIFDAKGSYAIAFATAAVTPWSVWAGRVKLGLDDATQTRTLKLRASCCLRPTPGVSR
jgi:MFS family permease